jgi:molybdopterin/thiamine biosynthesis adenylyltransferase|tara:strand:+ start:168313 stop:169173 length:861 start_codon:yes stop_codon:yes gene_type:complete
MFDYKKAFSRNIGWVSDDELLTLKDKKVAIAGAGGVGGEHLVTLTRLGISNFNIADFDHFEVHNFNRQAGAFMSTIGQPKLSTMKNIALDINPEMQIKTFDEGINATNIEAFLDGVDIYVDSLDFFAFDARRLVFDKCHELGIPIVTAAPVGMGCAFLCFLPGQMSPEEYFGFGAAKNEDEAHIKFYIGLAPSMLQKGSLVVPEAADIINKKLPSTPMGIKLCAGVAGSYVLKILLGRGEVLAAPHGLHFDAYKNKFKKTWRPLGYRHPQQRLSLFLAKKVLLAKL